MPLFPIMAWFKRATAAGKRSFSDIAELRDAVVDIITRKRGVTSAVADPADPAKIVMRVDGLTYTADLTNLFNRMRASPDEDPDRLISEFTASMIDMRNRSVSEGNLVAVLRASDYVDQISKMKPGPLTESFVGELSIVYMADMPGSMSAVAQNSFPGKQLAELREVALDNVRKWLGHVKSDDELKVATLYFIDGNTLLSPTLILLDEFWKSISDRYPGNVLIAVPRRDQLFLFNDDEQGLALAHRLIDVTFRDGFSLLSNKLFARRNGKIVSAER